MVIAVYSNVWQIFEYDNVSIWSYFMQATFIIDNKFCQHLLLIRHLGDVFEYFKRGESWKSYITFLPGFGNWPIP
jgi:hypothetical protein